MVLLDGLIYLSTLLFRFFPCLSDMFWKVASLAI